MQKDHSKYVAVTRMAMLLTLVAAAFALSGCSYSPSINIMGSYFPAWILCCMAGIGATALAHACFSRWKLLDQMWPRAVVYPCLICFISCLLWLVFFR